MRECIFCQIAKKEMNADIVYEDDAFVVFKDINPRAKVHLLIIPKKHYEQSPKILNTDSPETIGRMWETAKKVANELGLDSGYRVAMNLGRAAGQAVDHYHMHLLSGQKLGPEA